MDRPVQAARAISFASTFSFAHTTGVNRPIAVILADSRRVIQIFQVIDRVDSVPLATGQGGDGRRSRHRAALVAGSRQTHPAAAAAKASAMAGT